MYRRRGFSMIEVMMASALTVIVVGSLAAVYTYAAGEAADAVADVSATRQVQQLTAEIAKTVSQAVSVQIVSSGGNTGLKCIMPNTGSDTNADGYYDKYNPKGISKRGLEHYGFGKRIWFYRAGATGSFTLLGSVVWRAQRNDDAVPTSLDKDTSWTYYPGSTVGRWNLVDKLQFSNDTTKKITTVTVGASQLSRAERTASTTDVSSGDGYATVVSQAMFWRNWRK